MNGWYHQELCQGKMLHIISDGATWFEVDPETIGQYTGLIDTNGTPIYEGDIVRWNYDGELYVVTFLWGWTYIRVDRFNKGMCKGSTLQFFQDWPDGFADCKVVGNIYEKS